MNISLKRLLEEREEPCKIYNIFKQLDENIEWIGRQNLEKINKERNTYIEWLKEASEIYIFGFGFDINNLYRIGLTDGDGNLNKSIFENSKNIFISGVNAKIINQIRSLLDVASFEFRIVTINENVLEINFAKNKIILSKSYLPDVLNKDF